METKFLKSPKLPTFLPYGWKTEVAKALGIHPLTVTRNIRKGKGEMYDRIIRVAAAKYGVREESES